MNYNSNSPQIVDDSLDIKKYLFKLIGNWYWLVLGSLIGFFSAYLINRYTNPIYGVSTTLMLTIEDKESYFDRGLIEGLNLIKKSKNLENEKTVLKSYDLNSAVIRELGFNVTYISVGRIRKSEIYKPVSFFVEFDTSQYIQSNVPIELTFEADEMAFVQIKAIDTSFRTGLNSWIETSIFRFRIVDTSNEYYKVRKNEKYLIYYSSNEQLIRKYRASLQISTLSEDGTIFMLSSSGHVPEKEKDYLNKLTETYINRDLEEKHKIVTSAIGFIDKQLKDITDSLYTTEMRLQNFRLENDVLDITKEGQVLFSKYENLQNEKAQEVVKIKYLEYLQTMLIENRNEPSIITPGVAGIGDLALTGIITQINNLKSERQTLEFSTRKELAKLQLIDQKIASLEEVLLTNVNSIIEQSNIKIRSLDARIESVVAEMKKQPVNERLLLGIKRKFTLNDNIYTYLLEKRAEAGIKKASILSDAKVLDAAGLSGYSYLAPKKGQNHIIGVLIGVLIPILIILIIDYLNIKVIDRKEVEENTTVPILGSIGHNTTNAELVVHEKPRSSITESFRSIKTNLQFVIGEEGCKVISLTSGISGEGKTFCSINLASVYATLNKKTVLIGLDLRRPKIHKEFGVGNEIGITNYLIGKASLKDIIVKTELSNLDIIPAGTPPPNPNQLLESKEFKDFIATLKANYDIIIIDTPPVALVSDAVYISTFCDATIFVIRLKYTTRQVYNIINDLYENRGLKNILITLNDVKHRGYYGYGNYGYSYGYGYGYSYGYGYNYGGYYDDTPPPKPWLMRMIDKIKKS